jgi:CelD/BcsL family acetyltransferase involved in cellulose biosynthesis
MKVAIESLGTDSTLEEWGALARTSPSGIFATPEWHKAVQEGFGDRGQAVVATIRDEGRLMGVAPFRMSSRYLFRETSLLGMGEGGYGLADYAGMLAAPGRERHVAEAVMVWLRDRGTWDVLDLQQLPEGPLTDALVDAVGPAGLPSLLQRQNICHVVHLPTTWAEYRARLSVGSREWLEKRPRKVERDLGAQVELVQPDQMIEEYTNLRRLQAQRFGEFTHESERRLTKVITAWLPMAQERGWVRMFRLRSRSRTIGGFLGYEYEGAFYAHSIAFEPQLERTRYSLGACLFAFALRWSIDRGLKRFDMMRGDHRYKERLGGEQRFNFRLRAFRHPVRGRAMEAAVRLRARLQGQSPWLATPA